jgi:cAMP-dependent protein kinase regulator
MTFGDESAVLDAADTRARAGDFKGALAVYQEVLARKPMDLHLRQKVAETLVFLGRRREAVAEMQAVVVRLALGGMLLRAMAICRAILELEPSHQETQRWLADLATRKGQGGGSVALPVASPAGGGGETPAPVTPSRAEDSGRLEGAGPMLAASGRLAVPQGTPAPGAEPTPGVRVDASHLSATPLLSDLPPAAFMSLVRKLHLQRVPPGTVVVREGEPGASMFIVVQGRVEVTRQGEGGRPTVVAEMTSGAFFGEMALVSSSPRLATVTARQETLLMELTRDLVDGLCADHPEVRPVLEEFHRKRLVANVLRASPLFHALPAERSGPVVEAFETLNVTTGEVLLRQGLPGDGLYLVLRGRCQAVVVEDGEAEKPLSQMAEGDVFGEISLYFDTPATATVRALTPCVLLRLSRAAFESLVRPDRNLASAVFRMGMERLGRGGATSVVDVEMGDVNA